MMHDVKTLSDHKRALRLSPKISLFPERQRFGFLEEKEGGWYTCEFLSGLDGLKNVFFQGVWHLDVTKITLGEGSQPVNICDGRVSLIQRSL